MERPGDAGTGYRVFEDDGFALDQSDACLVPGYLVLRLGDGASSLADLAPERARALGALLSVAARALERVVRADRVYCLSFCEVDRRLHFHLFPRTRWLLEAYWRATGTADEPVNGPLLFEWARTTLVPGGALPHEAPDVAGVCERLRAILAGPR